jgi:hypothetical protein
MPYNITLTNGSALLTLADGTEDSVTTSLNLVGRNFPGYGLFVNENFIKLLENFSSTTAPTNPLVGQLWWDSTSRHLNVWQGTNWKVISSSMTGTVAPANPVTGDFWWNTTATQLSVYNGSQWIGVGPATLPGAALTALTGNVVSDGLTTHNVGNIMVNNKLVGIASSDNTAFNPVGTSFTTINPGLNLLTGVYAAGNIVTTSSLSVSGNTVVSGNIASGNISATTGAFANITAGNVSFSGTVVFSGPITLPTTPTQTFSSNIVPTANLTYNLGSPTTWWNNIYGTSIHAQYADLAERFESDIEYTPGTVVELGGTAEITAVVDELSEEVFGVISTRAAFVMNGTAGSDITHPPVAVQGRVPVNVIGKVKKGDRLVSAGNGLARSGKKSEITAWNVIGRSLDNKITDGAGIIEAVVKLNS